MLSGNRNFEGRINPDVKMNYLASPPLVVAYALAGTMDVDLADRAARARAPTASRCSCSDIWPSPRRSQEVVAASIASEMFTRDYADVFAGDERWKALPTPTGDTFAWDARSTYVRKPPYFDGMDREPAPVDRHHRRARAGHARRPRHHRPHLPRRLDQDRLARPGSTSSSTASSARDFNSYGSRRGNHEVMIRGTFANIRLRNQLAPGTEGGVTRNLPDRRADDDLRRVRARTRRPACRW